MSKLKEIKKRIKSVNNISQVTNAMQLVAASRMRRAQENAKKGKQYAQRIKEIMLQLSLNKALTVNPLINPVYSDSHTILVLVFSPQRGLAGALPSNLLRYIHGFHQQLKSERYEVQYVTIGQKLRDFMISSNYSILADFSDLPEEPTTGDIRPIVTLITDLYLEKKVKKVFMVFPMFINAITQQPQSTVLLPLDMEGLGMAHEELPEQIEAEDLSAFTFEPTEEVILDELIPSYLETQLYQTRLETIASEYSARMLAMKNATDNAKEIKADLTIDYNKSRQAQITQELSEINSSRMERF
jgi:F-type H+-transporting ATPase subunit gamma